MSAPVRPGLCAVPGVSLSAQLPTDRAPGVRGADIAGGHALVVAATGARAKAAVGQVPAWFARYL